MRRDKDADVIDIDAEETPVTRGMRRRKARTGNADKSTSRVLWIVVGAMGFVITTRVIDAFFPRQPVVVLPPPEPPVV